MKKIGVGQYWYTEPKEVKDTINAFVSILRRAFDKNQLSVAHQWADSILSKEDSSLAGWQWKAEIYERQNDTANAISCYDRMISIYENNHDPLIDLTDFLKTTSDERLWAKDRYDHAMCFRWKLVNKINLVEE